MFDFIESLNPRSRTQESLLPLLKWSVQLNMAFFQYLQTKCLFSMWDFLFGSFAPPLSPKSLDNCSKIFSSLYCRFSSLTGLRCVYISVHTHRSLHDQNVADASLQRGLQWSAGRSSPFMWLKSTTTDSNY